MRPWRALLLLVLVAVPTLASAETLQRLGSSPVLGRAVWAVAWSPGGDMLAAGGDFEGVALLKRTGVAGLKLVGTYTTISRVDGVSWSGDGRYVFFSGEGARLAMLDADTGALLYLDPRPPRSFATGWMPGYVLAGGVGHLSLYAETRDGLVWLWSLLPGNISCLPDMRGFGVVSIAADPYNRVFYASGFYNDTLGRLHGLVVAVKPDTGTVACAASEDLGLGSEPYIPKVLVIEGAWVAVVLGYSTGLAEVVWFDGSQLRGEPSTRIEAYQTGNLGIDAAWTSSGLLVSSTDPGFNVAYMTLSNPLGGKSYKLLNTTSCVTGIGYGLSVNPATGVIAAACRDGAVRLYSLGSPGAHTVTVTVTVEKTRTVTDTETRWITLTETRTTTVEHTIVLTNTLTIRSVETRVTTIPVTSFVTVTETSTSTVTTTETRTETVTETLTINRTILNTTTVTVTAKHRVNPGTALTAVSAVSAAAVLAAALAARRLS